MTAVTITSNQGGGSNNCGCCEGWLDLCVTKDGDSDFQLLIGLTPDCSGPLISMDPQPDLQAVIDAITAWIQTTVIPSTGLNTVWFFLTSSTYDGETLIGFCIRYKVSKEFFELLSGQSICGVPVYNCSVGLNVEFSPAAEFQCC